MAEPNRIPDLSWADSDAMEIMFTNDIGPMARDGVIAFVTMPPFQEDHIVEITPDEARCLRRWLDDALIAAGIY